MANKISFEGVIKNHLFISTLIGAGLAVTAILMIVDKLTFGQIWDTVIAIALLSGLSAYLIEKQFKTSPLASSAIGTLAGVSVYDFAWAFITKTANHAVNGFVPFILFTLTYVVPATIIFHIIYKKVFLKKNLFKDKILGVRI
jgi:hypothetical protein